MNKTEHIIEVNGSDVDVAIYWDVVECECSTDRGTERWTEATPTQAEIEDHTGLKVYDFEGPQTAAEQALERALFEGEVSYE
jgi:hypothetical protein